VLLLVLILRRHLCAGSYLVNLVWILAGRLPMHTARPSGRPRLAGTVAGLLLLLLLLLFLQALPWQVTSCCREIWIIWVWLLAWRLAVQAPGATRRCRSS
jgi:hypothetical protein